MATGVLAGQETASPAVAKCCRVWLPDLVLPCGDRLRGALEGTNGSNFAFLRKKYSDNMKFSIYGKASLDMPPWKRLQIVAMGTDPNLMSKVEQDLVDLAETACDVVADSLGLTEEQIQKAFEEIRVEHHDMHPGSMAPKPAASPVIAATVPAAGHSIGKAPPPLLPEGWRPAPPARPSALRPAPPVAPTVKRPAEAAGSADTAPHKKRKSDKDKGKEKGKKSKKDKADKLQKRLEAAVAQAPVVTPVQPAVPKEASPAPQVASREATGTLGDATRHAAAASAQPAESKRGGLAEEEGGSSSSESGSEESSASGEADAEGRPRIKLFKLGDFCCDVTATFMGGNKYPEQLPATLQIDQRAKLERCLEHVEWAGDLASVWQLTVRKGQSAYDALGEYFVAKQRVGLAEMPRCAIYFVPPEDEFLTALGLAASQQMMCIQVPTVDDREEAEPSSVGPTAGHAVRQDGELTTRPV
mmetsp:Transcript_62485/g.116117  ORF Transcript_62485/g.116117 Transcript_62485/m.116117 type:complete len:472 (-) Transcript_62485:3-1418(-)